MHAIIIHKTVLHIGKSVPNLLREISHSKVTADKAGCPTAVFYFSLGWQWWNEEKDKSFTRRRDTSPTLCNKNIPGDLEMASLLQRSPQGLIETSLHCQGLGISHFLSLILLHLFLPPPSLLPFCLLGRLLLLEKHRFKTSLFPLILSQTRISEPHTSTPTTVPEHLSSWLSQTHPPYSQECCATYWSRGSG